MTVLWGIHENKPRTSCGRVFSTVKMGEIGIFLK